MLPQNSILDMGVIYMMKTIKTNTQLWQEVYDTHAESLRGGQYSYVLGFFLFHNNKYTGYKLFSNLMSMNVAGQVYALARKLGVQFGNWTAAKYTV